MKHYQKLGCILLTGLLLLTAGCQQNSNTTPAVTTAPGEEVTAEMGKSAEYGGMTMTLLSVEDPEIKMDNGNSAIFFQVELKNDTDNSVEANWLNNFSLTVDGTLYDSDKCCTIPVMKKLYDFYGVEAMTEDIPAKTTKTGYIACEVQSNFNTLELHYIPKTTDRASQITVPITKDQIIKAEKK